MIGRYGLDPLSLFVMVVNMLMTLIASFFGGNIVVLLLSYILWFWTIFRMLSRNIEARRRENDRFMVFWNWLKDHTVGLRGWFRTEGNRARDRKTHKYFRCPKCHQMVRVPRHKGKVRIICPKCKEEFIRSTGQSAAQKAKKQQAKAAKKK
jgi:phage FluMu protein Com